MNQLIIAGAILVAVVLTSYFSSKEDRSHKI
jgi:hypothetical protein